MVTDLHDAAFGKRQPKGLVEPPEDSSKISSWGNQNDPVIKNLEFMPQTSEINEASISFLIDESEYKKIERKNNNYLP